MTMKKFVLLFYLLSMLVGCATEYTIVAPDASEISETQNRGRYAQVRNHAGEIIYQTDRYDYDGCRITAHFFQNNLVSKFGASGKRLVDCTNNDHSRYLPYLLTYQDSSSSMSLYFRDFKTCDTSMVLFEKVTRIYDRCTVRSVK